jgi:hypothetical protein
MGRRVPQVLLLIASLSLPPGLVAQATWQPVTSTSATGTSFAAASMVVVSQEVVSIWVQRQTQDFGRVLERYEINCVTQQRRLLEVWVRPESPESAPAALVDQSWTVTIANTPMRELVARVCAEWSLSKQ